jgi:hypothetical protein
VHVSFIATLLVEPGQAIWPIDDVPRLMAEALTPIPDYELSPELNLVRIDSANGRGPYSSLTDADRAEVSEQCVRLGLPSLLEFTTWHGIGPHLETFNTAPSRPGWLLGYLPPEDPYSAHRISRVIDEQTYLETLNAAIERGEVIQRLNNGAQVNAGFRVQGAVLSRKDLETFCASLLIEVRDKETRQRFIVPVWPREVPPALLALLASAPETKVLLCDGPRPGIKGEGWTCARDAVETFTTIIKRQCNGLFTVAEAAQILADAREAKTAREWVQDMRTANGEMVEKTYPDRSRGMAPKLAIRNGSEGLRGANDDVRDECEFVLASDLDTWLRNDKRSYGFPPAEALAQSGVRSTEAARLEQGEQDVGAQWPLKDRVMRDDGLSTPVHEALKAAHQAGKPRPTAREVLAYFDGPNRPKTIVRVLADGCDYFGRHGNEQSADLKKISKRIVELTTRQRGVRGA